MNDIQFKSCGKECVEVKTRTVTYRVYACGKLQKLTWDELNPNEEYTTVSDTSTLTIGTWLDSVTTVVE